MAPFPAYHQPDKWDKRFMMMAIMVASWSKDPAGGVGAVLTNDKRVLSLGFNGFPAGVTDDPSRDRDGKLLRTIHAEMNALLQYRAAIPRLAILYVTRKPCSHCTAAIIQAGVNTVFYLDVAGINPKWADSFHAADEMAEEVELDMRPMKFDLNEPVDCLTELFSEMAEAAGQMAMVRENERTKPGDDGDIPF